MSILLVELPKFATELNFLDFEVVAPTSLAAGTHSAHHVARAVLVQDYSEAGNQMEA